MVIDSGHGSQVKDLNGDEIDGYDEGKLQGAKVSSASDLGSVIFPLDYQRNGHISDDASISSCYEIIRVLITTGL